MHFHGADCKMCIRFSGHVIAVPNKAPEMNGYTLTKRENKPPNDSKMFLFIVVTYVVPKKL